MTSATLGTNRMRISSIGYCLKQGMKNIWRNKMFSLASIATMSACIFLFGIFFCVVENFQYMVREAEKSVAVTVFFDEGLSDEEIDDLLVLDVKDDSYFSDQGVTNQHGQGGGLFVEDDVVMGWLLGK